MRNKAGFGAFRITMIAILLTICYAKGEPPLWRWSKG